MSSASRRIDASCRSDSSDVATAHDARTVDFRFRGNELTRLVLKIGGATTTTCGDTVITFLSRGLAAGLRLDIPRLVEPINGHTVLLLDHFSGFFRRRSIGSYWLEVNEATVIGDNRNSRNNNPVEQSVGVMRAQVFDLFGGRSGRNIKPEYRSKNLLLL